LREVDFWGLDGPRWEQVQEKFNVSRYQWLHQLDAGLIPNADSSETFRARVEPCLAFVLGGASRPDVAIRVPRWNRSMLLSLLVAAFCQDGHVRN